MNFEEWWKRYKTEITSYEEYMAAQSAWNAALEEAAKAVEWIDATHAYKPAADIRAMKEK